MSMPLIWTLILVITLIVEALTIDLVSIWFSIGALLTIILALFNIPIPYQITFFLVVSIAFIIIVRPYIKRYLKVRTVKTNLDRIIGQRCLVLKDITPDNKGEVKVMGTLWSATSIDNEPIKKDEHAKIISIEGSHVVVKKLDV